eukprot:scpid97252/ scgid4552/ TNF receptor-associated factor family protein DDB_G0273433/DDB_G0273509
MPKIFTDRHAEREIGEWVKVYCSMNTNGCTWTGKLRNVEDHTAVCEYTNVRCPNEGCSEAVHRNQLNHHVTDVCRYTPVPCALCSVLVPQALTPDHIAQECINAEVQCAMCRNEIKRKELVQHMAEDCPNKTVVCPYHQYSCAFEGTREQVDRHCESQKEHHMHLRSQKTKSQEVLTAEQCTESNDIQTPRSKAMDPKAKDGPPLYGYDVQTVSPLPEHYQWQCPICLLVLRDPVQIDCGHRFCGSCIKRVIDSGNEICPVDHEPVTCVS